MDEIIEILEDLRPGVDYATCTTLIDDRYLDSLAIVALVAELEDAFDISIPAVEVVRENFNSVQAMHKMVTAWHSCLWRRSARQRRRVA